MTHTAFILVCIGLFQSARWVGQISDWLWHRALDRVIDKHSVGEQEQLFCARHGQIYVGSCRMCEPVRMVDNLGGYPDQCIHHKKLYEICPSCQKVGI